MELVMPEEEESWREWEDGRKTDEANVVAFQKCLKNGHNWLDKV